MEKKMSRATSIIEMMEMQGKGTKPEGTGGADVCVCPECKKEFKHERGVPCNENKCPDCDVELTGKGASGDTSEGKNSKYIVTIRRDHGKDRTTEGTIAELIDYFRYTLEQGKSWEHEKGNKKVNKSPKSIKALITSLNNATNNAAANGYSGTSYDFEEI
jgi:hypothetical protein